MKKQFCLFYLLICAAFSACENTSPQNSQPNINKTANNKDVSVAVNTKANENLNSETADEKNDFAGTAGIVEKKYEIKEAALLSAVRTARHDGYDRAVFEFATTEMPGYKIEYVDKPVRACGSGDVVPIAGDGWLEIRFYPANAHTEEGKPTVENRAFAPNHEIIKEMKLTCDFEAEVAWVLGVASPNRYRVLELKNPTRLAIDIKHK
jgi:hypothetical protein